MRETPAFAGGVRDHRDPGTGLASRAMLPLGPRSLDRTPVLAVVLGVVWLGSVCAGLAVMLDYENGAGVAATPPARWPAGSRLERVAGRATLVMSVHPHCPCSRASIEELDHI